MSLPPYLRAQADGVLLSVKLQPRASANEIGEPMGNELRIKVTAPPVDSAANEALIRLLAEKLDCPRNRVELLRGQTSRHHKGPGLNLVVDKPGHRGLEIRGWGARVRANADSHEKAHVLVSSAPHDERSPQRSTYYLLARAMLPLRV